MVVPVMRGGYWNNGAFNYNRSVSNVNVTNIHNVYNKTVINNTTVNNVSYNGGTGGITARPTQSEETAAREQHRPNGATDPACECRQHQSRTPGVRKSRPTGNRCNCEACRI